MRALLRFAATLGPVGHLPVAPATGASAITALVGWFLPAPPLAIAVALLVVGAGLAAWICDQAERELGHDAKPIVLDEVVGQTIALLGAPRSVPAFVAAFLLFRLFDIWKPLGARQAQSLSGGIGVVMDDVIAGVASCLSLYGLLRVTRLFGLPLGS